MIASVEPSIVVLFADLAGYTALTEAHGDADAADTAARFYAVARANLVGDARLVKTIGDAVMIVATSPADAVTTALRLVASVAAVADFPGVRVGIHAGGVIERDGDYFGATVNLAARVCAQAKTGQILCTSCVAQAIASLGLATLRSVGAAWLKNVHEAVELHCIGQMTEEVPVDPVCRMTVTASPERAHVEIEGKTFYFCSPACAAKFAAAPASYLRG